MNAGDRHILVSVSLKNDLNTQIKQIEDIMLEHLKIKQATLAAEARIIKAREQRLKKRAAKARERNKHQASEKLLGVRFSIHEHRKLKVRPEARAGNIAYGFLRGREYRQIEQKNHPDRPGPDWERVINIAARFGSQDQRDIAQKIEEWKTKEVP